MGLKNLWNSGLTLVVLADGGAVTSDWRKSLIQSVDKLVSRINANRESVSLGVTPGIRSGSCQEI
jgi:hypothetical protein